MVHYRIFLFVLLHQLFVIDGFRFPIVTSIRRRFKSVKNNSNNKKTSVKSLIKKEFPPTEELVEQSRLLEERKDLNLYLEKICTLENELKAIIQNTNNTSDFSQAENRSNILNETLNLCHLVGIDFEDLKKVNETKYTKATVESLSESEAKLATEYFLQIPLLYKVAFSKAVGVAGYDFENFDNSILETPIANKIIKELYKKRKDFLAQNSNQLRTLITSTIESNQKSSSFIGEEQYSNNIIDVMNNIDTDEEAKVQRFVESFLPKQTRKYGMAPTEKEVDIFLNLIDSSKAFERVEPAQKIPGGFIIRGNNKKEDGESLIGDLDESFKENTDLNKNFQFHYIVDPTPKALEDFEGTFGKPVLLLINKDLSPISSPFLRSLVSLFGCFLLLEFCFGTFDSNNIVMERLQNYNALGLADFGWFNELLNTLLFGFGFTLVFHELGHFLIAWKEKLEITFPVVLPSINLPFLGCSTSLTTSPKNLRQLFDFALAGPCLGFISSFVILFLGLKLTLAADAQTYENFPSLKLSFLQMSALGKSFMESILGQEVFLNSFNSSEDFDVQLHPFAIAGYTSLFINALNLLPLGNSDGGRMSQAIFGRNGHTLVQFLVYLGLLSSVIFNSHNSDIFLSYGLFCLLVQGEFEICCRNEVDSIDFFRILATISTWVVVILTLTPSI